MSDDQDQRPMTRAQRAEIEMSLADAPHGELEEFMRQCEDDFCVSCGCGVEIMPVEGCEDVNHVARFEAAKMPRRPRMDDGFVPLSSDETADKISMGDFTVLNILTRRQLMAFQRAYRMRESWHEPDEQDVSAFPAVGHSFDNAGCDPSDYDVEYARRQDDGGIHATVFSVLPKTNNAEHGVFLFHDGEPKAFVNLALLLAMACGYEGF
jgi:hypothetical protein